jgi:hypothetical protein
LKFIKRKFNEREANFIPSKKKEAENEETDPITPPMQS